MYSLLLLTVLPAVCLGGLAGGLTDETLTPNDPNVLFALGSINNLYSKLGDTAQRTLVKIESAKSQVVAGTLMHLILRVSSGGQEELCKVNVWSRPWMPADEATQVTQDPECKPAADQDPLAMVGGETPIDAQSSDVLAALNFAVTSLNAQENYMFMRKPTKIAKVTSQVVSGISYHFYGVEMSTTDCTKNSAALTLDNCSVTNGGSVRTCDFDVWYQSWMTPQYQLINVKC